MEKVVDYKLSIVIPVYNVELYIEECLNSVFYKLPVDVEVIIVNDGSPDKSIDIIKSKYKKWLDKDQVVLLEQKNKGLGAARNSGISIARGEYITFLDSDDILLDKYFDTLIPIIDNNTLDIIEFGFLRFSELSSIDYNNHKPTYKFEGLHNIEKIRNNIFSIGRWFACIRVFKRKLFEKNLFPIGVYYEDVLTISSIYLMKNLVIYIEKNPLLGYRVNPNSITSNHTNANANDMYKVYEDLRKHKSTLTIEILKIQTARTIFYFHTELGSLDFDIENIRLDIQKIKKRFTLIKHLKFPDLLFFLLPKIYMFIDKLRLKRKNKI